MVKSKKIPSSQELFSKKIHKLLNYILQEGFILTLVGGTVRDYFLSSNIGDDLDFEIRHNFLYEDEKWKKIIRKLAKKLQVEFELEIEYFEYGIFRFSYGGKDFEFASPRIEEFDKRENKLGHKDFKVKLISNLDYKIGFLRRDFRLNAIGIEFRNGKTVLIDPMKGVVDIERKQLNPCGEDFFKDPVRFLRLIRFKIKTGFKIGEKIKKNMKDFNLEKLSYSYVLKECFKSKSSLFFKEMFYFITKYSILTSEKIFSIRNMENFNTDSKNERDILKQMVFKHEFNDEDMWAFSDFSGVKKTYLKNLLNLKENLVLLDKINVDNILKTVTDNEFHEIQDLTPFAELSIILHLIKRNELLVSECKIYFSKNQNRVIECLNVLKDLKTLEMKGIEEIPQKDRKEAQIFYLLRMWKNLPK